MKLLVLIFLTLVTVYQVDAQITAPIETKVVTEDPEARYLVPIPEENGKVYLLREVVLPASLDQSEAYQKLQTWFTRCMQDARITQHTSIPSDQPNTIQTQVIQTITFSSGLLSLDTTEMTYVLTLSLQGSRAVLKMSHISYRYNGENRDRKMLRYTAEDHISDRVALNKKHTKMIFGYKKFRIKTIDLMDEYFTSLKNAFWIE